MQIARSRSERNHGQVTRDLGTLKFNRSAAGFAALAFDVPDFNTEAHHTYGIWISFEELAGLLRAAAESINESGCRTLQEALQPELKSLLHLALACVSPELDSDMSKQPNDALQAACEDVRA